MNEVNNKLKWWWGTDEPQYKTWAGDSSEPYDDLRVSDKTQPYEYLVVSDKTQPEKINKADLASPIKVVGI